MGPAWWISQLPLDLELQYTFIVSHQQAKGRIHRWHDSSQADPQRPNVGGGPLPGNLHHFPDILGITLPPINL